MFDSFMIHFEVECDDLTLKLVLEFISNLIVPFDVGRTHS